MYVKRKMARAIAVHMVLLLLALAVAGCGDSAPAATDGVTEGSAAPAASTAAAADAGNGSAEPQGAPAEIRYVAPGSEIPDIGRVLPKINEKIAADGLNFTLKIDRIAWDVWDQKLNLMISTKEDFDVVHVMQGRLDFDAMAASGALAPIPRSVLDEHGKALLNMIDGETWAAASWKGEIYTVPALWTPTVAARPSVTIRKDLYDKYGVALPESYEDMLRQGKLLQDAIFADTGETYYDLSFSIDMPNTDSTYFADDPSYPFFVGAGSFANSGTQLVKINGDGSTEPWLESAAFKAGCDRRNEFFKAGLIHPDVLTIPRDVYMTQFISGGKGLYGVSGYWERINEIIPGAEVAMLDFTEGKEFVGYINSFFYNSNGISSSSSHQVESVQFLNWLQDEENGKLLCYGEKGVDWFDSERDAKPDGVYPKDLYFTQAKAEGGYFFDMWEFLPWQYRMYADSTPEFIAEPALADRTEYAVCAGFQFDAAPVQNEWTALDAAYIEWIWPIQLGVKNYDESIGEALAALRSMGMDKVVTEYDRQFQEWLAAKNA
jgi:putative aldouronate transport system substrate-binding protein